MLNKNVWIPILILVLVAIGFGLFYRQKVANQEPVKVSKPVDVSKPEVSEGSPVTETPEGHFHADGTFHAQPHADATADVAGENPGGGGAADRSGAVSPGGGSASQRVPRSDESVPPVSVKLDPETQARVDALYKQSDALAEEASVWNDKLYAEREAFLKGQEALKAENQKLRQMRKDPNVDEATYRAFDAALDAKMRAQHAVFLRRDAQHKQNVERWDESMRLIDEARRLQGIK